MSELKVSELDALVAVIMEQRAVIEKVEETLTGMNKELYRLEGRAAAYLKELNRTSYDSPHGSITLMKRVAYTVPKTLEDRESFFNYLKEQQVFDQMITVNYNTLNSYAKKFTRPPKSGGICSQRSQAYQIQR